MKQFVFIPVLCCVLLAGCKDSKKEECVSIPDISGIELSIRFESFEDSLADISSKAELFALLTRQPLIRDYMLRRTEYPNDSVFIDAMLKRFTNPHIDTLLMETKRVFGDLSSLRSEFETAFKNIKSYYPDFTPPKIQTMISGLDTDLFVSDTLIIVGLDYYLGKDARYRPKMYDYLLRKYDPNDIVPTCLLIYGIGDRFNKTDMNDKTVLADMVAYGKSFYFAKHMLPCVPDSVLISYSPAEMEGSRSNEDLIWARFVESQVIYSTSHMVKKDYLGERPVTIQVGEKCPGRIGQWVGWEIVKAYMDSHPELSLPAMMQFENAQQLFKESRYKPGGR